MITLSTKKTSPPAEVRMDHIHPDRIRKTPTKDATYTKDANSGKQGDAKENWRAGEDWDQLIWEVELDRQMTMTRMILQKLRMHQIENQIGREKKREIHIMERKSN